MLVYIWSLPITGGPVLQTSCSMVGFRGMKRFSVCWVGSETWGGQFKAEMEFILVNWLSGVLVRDRFPSLRMGRGNGLYEFQQHGDVWELSFEMCFRQVGSSPYSQQCAVEGKQGKEGSISWRQGQFYLLWVQCAHISILPPVYRSFALADEGGLRKTAFDLVAGGWDANILLLTRSEVFVSCSVPTASSCLLSMHFAPSLEAQV